MKRTLLIILGIALLVVVSIQLVPIRVANPPVIEEPKWDSPKTALLARRACYDCHSNEVNVPFYGKIAPLSWIVAHHVDEGREHLNFSEMNRRQKEAHEAGEEVHEGEMPPSYYTALHPEARLSSEEKTALARGLDRTLGGDDGHDDHD